ncbi:TPA: hypothetical protein N0F65_003142 [Lagenidium giganteum]|uniref:Ion transport domain-containing protein n=1 Tax=Lagenidium giganteum TaxID=4803 RepID=A0AAV2YHH2_9STRA|nr:TPA: hypothetical protein N0F65_003142 [Lagenidium giganteum]
MDGNRTPLMLAAAYGLATACHALVARGARPQDKTQDGMTALTFALQHGHAACARVLIDADKDEGVRHLLHAIARESLTDMAFLLDLGVSPNAALRSRGRERIAVHEAIAHASALKMLLDRGANANIKDERSRSALVVAAAAGKVEACKLLLQFGASITSKDLRGRTPMYFALTQEREDVVQYFLGLEGVNIDACTTLNRTALFFHAERGNVRGCAMMLRFHCNPMHRDVFGWSALQLAASYGHKEVCRMLSRDTGSSDSVTSDRKGMAPLLCRPARASSCWASVSQSTLVRIYSELINIGVHAISVKYGTLMIRDCEMNTLLHVAAEHADGFQCHYIVKCLHAVGNISVNIQNCWNKSPLDIALECSNSCSAALLKSLRSKQLLGEQESFHLRVSKTLTRRTGDKLLASLTSGDFYECSRGRLAQLCRGIDEGVYTCNDDIVSQVDNERGDSVLHYFLIECVQGSEFPSVERQRELLCSEKWLKDITRNRTLRSFISKRNWEGKTPLHVAAERGAFGFCQVLVEKGASAGEECSAPDKRLVDQSAENTQFWKAINFACTCQSSTSAGHPPTEDRAQLVEFLLQLPDALPVDEAALRDCQEKIQAFFPRLLPLFQRVHDRVKFKDEYAEAKQLHMQFLDSCYKYLTDADRSAIEEDPSGVAIHKVYLDTALHGLQPLRKLVVPQISIFSTGDTLLHVVAAHGHRDYGALIPFLIQEGGLEVNAADQPEICRVLIAVGADVTVASSNLITPSLGPWLTPLYCALWAPKPPLEVIEILLLEPASIVEPSNPKWRRSDTHTSTKSEVMEMKWNEHVLRQLLNVHPAAISLYLDHFATVVNRLNGDKCHRFHEVHTICEHTELLLSSTSPTSAPQHHYAVITHPVIRHALHVKWKLFGAYCHRRHLTLYVLMVVSFFASNLILPSLQLTRPPREDGGDAAADSPTEMHKWIAFTRPIDYFVAATKSLCWVLACYHLVYVELWLEWRPDRGRYWRSLWNVLDMGTYILLLGSIPLEMFSAFDTLRECVLSVLSILLCANLMQSLLVSSFFSVLIFTFARMCRVVAQFLFLYLLLLVGFAGAFHLLFHGLGPHVDPLSSMRVVFLATFGELNYARNFHFKQAENVRNAFGFALLVTYIVVVLVVALNLLVALMTSEYERVRAQAEERSLLELAGALHRYEKWLGRDVVDARYASDRGRDLTRAVTRSISRSTGDHQQHARPRTRSDVQDIRTPVATVDVQAIADAVATDLAQRLVEETAALRRQVSTQVASALREALPSVSACRACAKE